MTARFDMLGALGALVMLAFAVAVASGPGANAVRAFLARQARTDFATFVGLVGRDERTGAPLKLNRQHRRVLALWEKHPRSVVWAHPEFGKTSLLVLWALWTLGRDASTRIVIASGTASQGEKLLRAIASYVEASADLRAVFPSLAPGKVWRNDALSVAGAPATMKDANVSTAAPGSGSVLGLRCDVLILDDMLTRENTRTAERREELLRWCVSTLLSRLAPDARVIACGTVWHREDLLATLASFPGFVAHRFAVLDANGASTWAERWPATRIAERRAELGAREFARAFLCEPVDDASAVFRFDDVDAALKRGVNLPAYVYSSPAETGRCFVACDPAFTTSERADLSAIAVVCVRPTGERELLEIRAGRWGFDGIVARVVELAAQYRANAIGLETNGGGALILDDLKKHARGRVVGLHTSAVTKAARIERFAAELEARRWILPCRGGVPEPDVRALVQETLAFTPEDHLGDRLSAVLLALDVIRTDENRPRCGFFPVHTILRRHALY